MIMGYGRHGKDSVGEYLRDKYGFTFQSSSYAAAEALFPLLRVIHGYASVEEAYEKRHGFLYVDDYEGEGDGELSDVPNRQIWYEAIRLLNQGDLTTLAKQIYKKSDIYVGIRNIEEYRAIKAKRMFDLSIWVDAELRLPPEDATSITVNKFDADLVLDNNGSLEDLYAKIDNLVQKSIIRVN